MIVEMMLSGFLFLFIIIINLVGERFGTPLEQRLSDLDSDAKLQKINNDPKKFKISIVLALIEHASLISVAVMLFLAFGPVNIILGIVWVFFRAGEGLIQIYNKKNYWGLLNIARQYSGTTGAEKNALIDLGRNILKIKKLYFHILTNLILHWYARILNPVCYLWSCTSNYWMVWNCCEHSLWLRYGDNTCKT